MRTADTQQATTTGPGTEHAPTVVVGAGFAGLGMAIRLRQAGREVLVLERGDDVGGTWRDNTYPGAACDVPSHLYSFSFAPNPDWSHSFSPQPEIEAYLRRVAREYGVLDRIRFGVELREAAYDDATARWRLTTSAGELTTDVLILGVGALSEPSVPALPGLESFQGTVFHSARWAHDHDLSGERVAVVGTGASAIQFVPQIAPEVAALHVFQRTPPWLLPRLDREFSGIERRLFRRLPSLQRLVRAGIYWAREAYVLGFTVDHRIMRLAEKAARRHLAQQVPDPQLRRVLTPDYTIGCKRILISSDYYPALTLPHVEVVPHGVREVRPHSVVAADGTERAVDTIIFGTGFHVTDLPVADRIRGRGGRLLADDWRDGQQAYRGTTVTGYPNLFMLVGPNTGLGHTSMVYMIESQVAYVLGALRALDAPDVDALEVRPEAQDAYNAEVQRRMRRTVWLQGGCASWYLDAEGRNTTLWPAASWRFRRLTRTFDPDAYRPHTRAPLSPGAVPQERPAPEEVPT